MPAGPDPCSVQQPRFRDCLESKALNAPAQVTTKRLVIGCGTGRCGTVSLVKFLNAQAGISVLHEGVVDDGRMHHLVPWYGGEAQLWSWLARLEAMSNDATWYGDVGFYFLPYLPAIFDRYPMARVICLERSRKAVIRSYLEKTEGRNHWYRHNGVGWQQDPEWDDCFPWYDEPDKAKALGLYWDHYHCTAVEYRARFPRQFMLLPTAALNEVDGRRRILEFIGHDVAGAADGEFRSNAIYKNRLRRAATYLSSRFGKSGRV
jgi:hypothetical protein